MKRILFFLTILFIGSLLLILWWRDATSAVDTNNQTPVMFEISQNQTIKEIASSLKRENLIKDQVAFFVYIRLSGIAPKIQAGNFRLSKSMNVYQISQALTHGTSDIWVTIIEGLRKEEVAQIFSQQMTIPEGEFLKFAKEGYMFPDTYLIPKNSSAEAIVEMIIANFDKKVSPDIIEIGKQQGLNLNEILTLASIIEREVKEDKDRVIVAGILLKRLREGWPLQIDATIQYALGYQPKEKTWWKKELTEEDLKIDSSYNSYINVGLPPGPISNPGLASITAVVKPQKSQYWYYISDLNGKIHYSETDEEHQANIDKYLR